MGGGYFSVGNGDMKIKSAHVPFDVQPGEYRMALGIRDPWQNRPAIRFANELPVIDGWTVLSRIKITK